jgi:hypothetical protein
MLHLARRFAHNPPMANQGNPQDPPKSFWRWAITPPQSYAVYLIALVLVWGLSFYAGMLRPKTPTGLGPPPVSVPQR